MKMAVGVVVLDPRTESTTDHTRTVQRTTINASDCHVHGVVEFTVRILEYITYLASEPVRQASRSKRARNASSTFIFLLHNKVWL
jgi:hypothetical protein